MSSISFNPHKTSVFSFYRSENKAQKSKMIHPRPHRCYMDLNPRFLEASYAKLRLTEQWGWELSGTCVWHLRKPGSSEADFPGSQSKLVTELKRDPKSQGTQAFPVPVPAALPLNTPRAWEERCGSQTSQALSARKARGFTKEATR